MDEDVGYGDAPGHREPDAAGGAFEEAQLPGEEVDYGQSRHEECGEENYLQSLLTWPTLGMLFARWLKTEPKTLVSAAAVTSPRTNLWFSFKVCMDARSSSLLWGRITCWRTAPV